MTRAAPRRGPPSRGPGAASPVEGGGAGRQGRRGDDGDLKICGRHCGDVRFVRMFEALGRMRGLSARGAEGAGHRLERAAQFLRSRALACGEASRMVTAMPLRREGRVARGRVLGSGGLTTPVAAARGRAGSNDTRRASKEPLSNIRPRQTRTPGAAPRLCARFSAISRPMNPAPMTTARRTPLAWM